MDHKIIKDTFVAKFNNAPRIFRSPGRINIIGEHTDYNDGFVLPAAIDKEILAALAPNGLGNIGRLYALDLDEYFEFDINKLKPVSLGWPNYILGVVNQIIERGINVPGFDCVIGGDVPLGAGLSSSAALESVIGFGLNSLFDLGIEKIDIIKIGQKAEHTFAGVKCGIMDQFASVMGKKDQVFRLDCRSLEHEYFPVDLGDYQLVLLNSNVKHSLASTEYNTRREECETGVKILNKFHPEVNSLRDVTLTMLEQYKKEMTALIHKRCSYVVEENDRVLKACDALLRGDNRTLGDLIYLSHQGLSNDYEVSCPEIDFLVDQTKNKEYILGSRMMGGGFGGCTINIVRKNMTSQFVEELSSSYKSTFDKDLTQIDVSIENGSSEVV